MVTFVQATYVLATFVHITKISAVTDPIFTNIFWLNFCGEIFFEVFWNFFWIHNFVSNQKVFRTQKFFGPIFFYRPNIGMGLGDIHWRRGIKPFQAEHFRLKSFFFLFFPFFLFPSVATFSHKRSGQIKKPFLRKLMGVSKNLGVDTFPDPVSHFWAPWRPFWILQVVQRCRRWVSAPGAARLVLFYPAKY